MNLNSNSFRALSAVAISPLLPGIAIIALYALQYGPHSLFEGGTALWFPKAVTLINYSVVLVFAIPVTWLMRRFGFNSVIYCAVLGFISGFLLCTTFVGFEPSHLSAAFGSGVLGMCEGALFWSIAYLKV